MHASPLVYPRLLRRSRQISTNRIGEKHWCRLSVITVDRATDEKSFGHEDVEALYGIDRTDAVWNVHICPAGNASAVDSIGTAFVVFSVDAQHIEHASFEALDGTDGKILLVTTDGATKQDRFADKRIVLPYAPPNPEESAVSPVMLPIFASESISCRRFTAFALATIWL